MTYEIKPRDPVAVIRKAINGGSIIGMNKRGLDHPELALAHTLLDLMHAAHALGNHADIDFDRALAFAREEFNRDLGEGDSDE